MLQLAQPRSITYPPLVFTPEYVTRLKIMNQALRAIRDMGYRIVNADPMARARPEIKAECAAGQSIYRFLDKADGHCWKGRSTCLATYMGVNVTMLKE